MRVVVWNMAANTVSRSREVHDEAWRYLEAERPDVALLQEATVPAWARDRWTVHAPSAHRWGTVLLAQPELQLDRRTDGVIHDIAAGVIHPGGSPMTVISVYAPPVKVAAEQLAGRDPRSLALPRSRTVWARDIACAGARELAVGRFIAGGDWNTSPTLDDRLHPWKHEGDFFRRAEIDGWIDCHRRFHAEEGRTWFRTGQAPYQFDHVFCDPDTAASLRSCDIDPMPAKTLRLSDHAPLVVDLLWPTSTSSTTTPSSSASSCRFGHRFTGRRGHGGVSRPSFWAVPDRSDQC